MTTSAGIKHHYRALPESNELGAIREVLDHNTLATQEQFDDVRQRILDLSRVIEEVQRRIFPVHALFAESVDVNRRLTDQVTRLIDMVLIERQEMRTEAAHRAKAAAAAHAVAQASALGSAPAPGELPDYRAKQPSLRDIVEEAVVETLEQTGRHTVLTSHRVRELTREEREAERRDEDAKTWRGVRKNVLRIVWQVVGALALVAAGALGTALLNRAQHPPVVAPAAKER